MGEDRTTLAPIGAIGVHARQLPGEGHQAAEKDAEDKLAEQQALADEQGFEPAPPDGFKSPEKESPIKVKEGEKLVVPGE